jgi:hypothetical protein
MKEYPYVKVLGPSSWHLVSSHEPCDVKCHKDINQGGTFEPTEFILLPPKTSDVKVSAGPANAGQQLYGHSSMGPLRNKSNYRYFRRYSRRGFADKELVHTKISLVISGILIHAAGFRKKQWGVS